MQAPRSSRFELVWVDPSGGPLDLWPTRPFALNPPLPTNDLKLFKSLSRVTTHTCSLLLCLVSKYTADHLTTDDRITDSKTSELVITA